MALIAAKCTQCGANIEVDQNRDAGICPHCGTAFVTEKVINNYNITYNVTKVINDATRVEDWIEDGEILLNMGEYERALDAFQRITIDQPEDWRGWFYTAKVMLMLFERNQKSYAQKMYSCIKRAYEFGSKSASDEEKNNIIIYYVKILRYQIEQREQQKAEILKKIDQKIEEKAEDKTMGWICVLGLAAVFIPLIIMFALIEDAVIFVIFTVGMFLVLLGVVAARYFHLFSTDDGKYNLQIEEYDRQIKAINEEIDAL